MNTDGNLTGSQKVQELQRVLHTQAKEEPGRRFHALCDKVWRRDFLMEAYQAVYRNRGAAGVDGESFEDIERYGVERWLGEWSRELKERTYRPEAVREVRIPKKAPGQHRTLGIPCIRDRVVQTSAGMVLGPIFEADLPPEQYAYRPRRSAQDAVKRVHRLLNQGRNEVVEGDLRNYFGEIPHAELMKSIARRVSDGRMLGWVKAWLEMPVVGDDGHGGTRRTCSARRKRKGVPQGSPISPLFSNLYLRRFILAWKTRGHARQFGAEIVNYADDFCILGQAPAENMRGAAKGILEELKLPINEEKTRCLRCPDEAFEFLGYRIGRNYRRTDGSRYIGTRPSKASVQSLCRRISERTGRRHTQREVEEVVEELTRMISGWANYFHLGQVGPAYRAIDAHAERRLRQWLCWKHKTRSGKYVRFSTARLRDQYGLIPLVPKTKGLPWAKV